MQFDDLNTGDRLLITTKDGEFHSVVFNGFIRDCGRGRYLACIDPIDDSLMEIPTCWVGAIEHVMSAEEMT